MKSGTSTLHHILRQHDEIFIPNGEIAYFSLDDFEQHPDFFPRTEGGWVDHDFERDHQRYFEWYRSFFEGASEGQVIGEDSTVYLASRKAPSRIAEELPGVKLIFLLRDPVRRTYSHYWHEVKMGRAEYDFEKTLQYQPGTLLQRSFYKNQLERYLNCFPEQLVKVILFERFVNDMQTVTSELCEFIGVSRKIDLTGIHTHRQPTVYPRSLGWQLCLNRLFRTYTGHRQYHPLPDMPDPSRNSLVEFLRKKLFENNLARDETPPMNRETREFLQKLLLRENRGLSRLIDLDLSQYWPWFDDT